MHRVAPKSLNFRSLRFVLWAILSVYVVSEYSGVAQSTNVVVFSNPSQMEADIRSVLRQMQESATNFQPNITNEAIRDWVNYLNSPEDSEAPFYWITNHEYLGVSPIKHNGNDFNRVVRSSVKTFSFAKGLIKFKAFLPEYPRFAEPKGFHTARVNMCRNFASYACGAAEAEGDDSLESFFSNVLSPTAAVIQQQVDYQALADAGLLAGKNFDQMSALKRMVVAVGKLDDRNRFAFNGSGFVVEDRLYTCAHVVAGYFFDHAASEILPSAKIALIFFSQNGYPESEAIEVEIRRENLFPETDVAIVPLSEQAKQKALAIDADIKNCYTTVEDESPIGASVFVWGIDGRTGTPNVAYGTPEPIYFPPVITKRVSSRLDQFLGYALWSHLEGMMWREGGPVAVMLHYRTNFNDFVSLALPPFTKPDSGSCGYTRCSSQRPDGGIKPGEICKLVYIPQDAYLLKIATNADFKNQPRIECFGIGLYGIPGMSGSPVFRLADGRQCLVGIYAGISATNTRNQQRPTLDCFGKAIPFGRVKNLVSK